MKRNLLRSHYPVEGNEEVLETGLLLRKTRPAAAHAMVASVCLGLFFGLLGEVAGAEEGGSPRVVHVFVALADNEHQGIIPVPSKLGNGDDPDRNLYWGAAYGVKTFFARSADWRRFTCFQKPKPEVLERCVFKHRLHHVYLVADAYQGRQIRQAIGDFLGAAAGQNSEMVTVTNSPPTLTVRAGGSAELVAYVGHEGLMDFSVAPQLPARDNTPHDTIILACLSKSYFAALLRSAGAQPLIWTTGLMAPEAYTLKGALDGWIQHEEASAIRDRAAQAYSRYQHCSLTAARRLLVSGW